MDSPTFEEMARDCGFDPSDFDESYLSDSGMGPSQHDYTYAAEGDSGEYMSEIGEFVLILHFPSCNLINNARTLIPVSTGTHSLNKRYFYLSTVLSIAARH